MQVWCVCRALSASNTLIYYTVWQQFPSNGSWLLVMILEFNWNENRPLSLYAPMSYTPHLKWSPVLWYSAAGQWHSMVYTKNAQTKVTHRVYVYIFFLEVLIAWFLFPEQLMPLIKHKKKPKQNTTLSSSFIINDSSGKFKNIAPHFVSLKTTSQWSKLQMSLS